MTPQELKNSILQLAIQGKLVEQRSEEGTAEELYQKIQAEKQRLIKAGKIKKEKPLPENVEDENPFDIPENWKWVRVQDLFNVRSAMRIHQTDWRTSGIPFFRGRELVQLVKTGNVDFEIYISRELYEANKAKGGVPQKDDLLISAVGTLGKVYVVQGTKEFYYKDAYILCLENISKIYPQYIKYALESPYNQIEIHRDSMATTVAQLTIIKAKRLLLPLPPLAEQKRIVAKIEELLPYIDRYEKAWSRLEDFNKRFPGDMKKSIFQLAIQGKLAEQRPEEGTAEELYQQIQVEKQRLIKAGKIKKEKPLPEIAEDEMPFEIPESWKWVSVGNVCINIQYGSSQKSSHTGKIAVLRMGNIQNGRLVLDKLVYTSDDKEIAKYPLQHDDLLFNRTNSKELVGKTAIYKSEIPAIYAGYLVRITPLLINSDYLNYVMQSHFYWSYCQGVRSDAIGQSNINAEKLKRFVFPLPPLAEQKRIVSKLAELLPLCERLK